MPGKRRASGTGSIFKSDTTGKWNAIIEDGYRDGKKHYCRKRCDTEAEAVAWLKEQQANTPTVVKRLTLGEWLDRWLADGMNSWAVRTQDGYTDIVRLYLKPNLGPYKLAQLSTLHVQSMVNYLHDQDKARNTIRNAVACLRVALNDAIAAGLIKENPAKYAKLPKAERQKRKVQSFTPDEAVRFLITVDRDRLKALYWLALFLGLRQAELIGLRVEDIDLEKRVLHVEQTYQRKRGKGLQPQGTKSRRSHSGVPLPDILIPVLRQHLAELAEERQLDGWQEHGLLFPSTVGTPFNPRTIYGYYIAHRDRAGLPKITFHDLRHSCGTLLTHLGVHPRIVMAILRHAQISTTMDIYVDDIPDANRAALNQLAELVTPVLLELPPKTPKT